ncbi:ROK family protein [Pedobacter agri]|uniref:ROK family protein n=1 Tax=Pedobacter agri TaxID=454586 RepID=UPI00292DC672|nr:ROK family protein [Pedobacter agri]
MILSKNRQLRAEIIKALYYKKSLSFKALSEFTNKSLPLITSTVHVLVKEGLLTEQGLAPSTGGRRASTFILNPARKGYLVALVVSQLSARLCIYDLSNNNICPTQSITLDATWPFNLKPLVDFINSCIATSKIERTCILGVGIGIPRFFDEGSETSSSVLEVDAVERLSNHLSQKLALPVFLDNDVNLIALAEMNFGEAMGIKNVLIINIDWKTGLSMILDGKIYRGSSGHAGEFSHIPLSKSPTLCSCGKLSCLEVDTSLQIMVKKALKAIAEGVQTSMRTRFEDKNLTLAEHFLNAVIRQDPTAIVIFIEAAFQLGRALATLIHLMNPERIILSGPGAKAGKILLSPIQQAINEFYIPRIADQTTILLSKLADQAELLAAGSLIMERSLFDEL